MHDLNEAKVQQKLAEFSSSYLSTEMQPDDVEQLMQLITSHAVTDLIELTKESLEVKQDMKEGKVLPTKIIETIQSQIEEGVREDVFMASLQRHMEMMIQEQKPNMNETQIASAENFIARLDKTEFYSQIAETSVPTATPVSNVPPAPTQNAPVQTPQPIPVQQPVPNTNTPGNTPINQQQPQVVAPIETTQTSETNTPSATETTGNVVPSKSPFS